MFRRLISLLVGATIMQAAAIQAPMGKVSPPQPKRGKPHLKKARQSRSKYQPHQGKRECERRRIGGFYTLHRSHVD